MQKNRAFTLIELLVVISIIGLLGSIVFAGLSTARAKARDTKRITDLKAIKTALESYAIDNGGNYPMIGQTSSTAGYIENSTGNKLVDVAVGSIAASIASCSGGGSNWPAGGAFMSVLNGTYLQVPKDPNNSSSNCYIYVVNPGGKGASVYTIGERLTVGGHPYYYGVTSGTPYSGFSTGFPTGFAIGQINNGGGGGLVQGMIQVITEGVNPNIGSGY